MTSRIWPFALLVLAAACMAWAVAIVVTRPSVVDGIPIGDRIGCETPSCRQFVDFATLWLDRAEPGHPAVAETTVHRTNYRDANGNQILTIRSGGSNAIVVFRLADGTDRAFDVGCGIGVASDLCFASSGPPDWQGSEPISVPGRP